MASAAKPCTSRAYPSNCGAGAESGFTSNACFSGAIAAAKSRFSMYACPRLMKPSLQAGITADKPRQFAVAISEFQKDTAHDPAFEDRLINLGQAYMGKGECAP